MRLEEFDNLMDSLKLREIYKSVEKTRKYIKWTMIISFAVIIIPLLFLPFVITRFFGAYDFSAFGL